MAFGLYIHIPYCLQRCTYCDFATVEWGHSLPPEEYYELLIQELKFRRELAPTDELTSVYFGGGTPSLVGPEFILSFMRELRNLGFHFAPDIEVTIEINPATMDLRALTQYQQGGVNRFSVGAQTFNEPLLKSTSRLHSVQDTRDTLKLLQQANVNYTFDLLFALPRQTVEQVQTDIEQALSYGPSHLSAYCLTVPDKHPMARGRATDDEQVVMFETIEAELKKEGLERYEISNFAKPGLESRHNLVYWTDEPYLGIGLGAHSYLPQLGPWGTRFSNVNSITAYREQMAQASEKGEWPLRDLRPVQFEELLLNQAVTDFMHISLRLIRGLNNDKLMKFPEHARVSIQNRLEALEQDGLLIRTPQGFKLSPRGLVLTNLVFERLTFLQDELREH